VLSHVQHADGEWGYGKVHAQIVRGACGQAFVATYWGTDANLRYGPTYQGDQLFRLDTTTLELQPLGVPVPKHGIPTLAGLRAGRLLYGEAPIPTTADATGSTTGAFFVYDPKARKIVFRADDDRLTGFRNVLVGPNGDAYVAAQSSQLLVYDPRANTLRLHSQRLPGGSLRASTEPARDGTVYGVTQDPDRLFALRADGQIDDLGPARGYTASVALDPNGQRFFYVPGAHGDSWQQGTPLLAVDTKTGAQTTVVTLNDLAEEKLGLTLAGSYSVAVDPSGTTVYIGMNAGHDRDEPWGEVVLIVVHLA
jgi:dipeptidyl aminopeptidase/acylaminoacyl peptidase